MRKIKLILEELIADFEAIPNPTDYQNNLDTKAIGRELYELYPDKDEVTEAEVSKFVREKYYDTVFKPSIKAISLKAHEEVLGRDRFELIKARPRPEATQGILRDIDTRWKSLCNAFNAHTNASWFKDPVLNEEAFYEIHKESFEKTAIGKTLTRTFEVITKPGSRSLVDTMMNRMN